MNSTNINRLHLLCTTDCEEAVQEVKRLLYLNQSDVNRLERYGLTPLHVAAAWSNLAMCKTLLEFGADPFIKDNYGRSVLDIASLPSKAFIEKHLGANEIRGKRKQSFSKFLKSLFACASRVSEREMPYEIRDFISEDPSSAHGYSVSRESSTSSGAHRKRCNALMSSFSSSNTGNTYITARDDSFSEVCKNFVGKNTLDDRHRQGHCIAATKGENNSNASSNNQSLEEILEKVRKMSDYQLKREFAMRNERIGPLTPSTRSAYEKKLARLMTHVNVIIERDNRSNKDYNWVMKRFFNGELKPEGRELDASIVAYFRNVRRNVWRDPSIIYDSNYCSMKEFTDAIFYIGKGKRSRAFHHLTEALNAESLNDDVQCKKVAKILELWSRGYGVVSLHVFQNVLPVEALTREAAMIDAIGLENLTNVKRGEYYGLSREWSIKQKLVYGAYLLSRALEVLHVEGCRQIFKRDIQTD